MPCKHTGEKGQYCSRCGDKIKKTYQPDFVLVGDPYYQFVKDKSKKLDWVYWFLVSLSVAAIVYNLLTDTQWTLYVLAVCSIGLFAYGIYQRERGMTPEESEEEFRVMFPDIWKKKLEREGKSVSAEEYKSINNVNKELDKMNQWRLLGFILVLGVFGISIGSQKQEFTDMPLWARGIMLLVGVSLIVLANKKVQNKRTP